MRALSYLVLLVGCLAATVPLEWVFGLRVLRRPRLLVATLALAATPFVLWDLWATERGHWAFDLDQTLGLTVPGGLPIEEVAFFVVIPLAILLTFEAVGAVLGRRSGDRS